MLAPWNKSYDKCRQHITNQTHYLTTKVHIVKAMFLLVVTYRCEGWTIKKAECWRIYAFEKWCWKRLLRVPWTARRSNQSILKEISPGVLGRTDVEAETPILWAPDVKSWLARKDPAWFWERLKIGEGGNRRWDCWMASLTQWTRVWANSRRQWRTGNYGMLQSIASQRVGYDWAIE